MNSGDALNVLFASSVQLVFPLQPQILTFAVKRVPLKPLHPSSSFRDHVQTSPNQFKTTPVNFPHRVQKYSSVQCGLNVHQPIIVLPGHVITIYTATNTTPYYGLYYYLPSHPLNRELYREVLIVHDVLGHLQQSFITPHQNHNKNTIIFRMKLPELLWTEVQAVGWKYQSWLQVENIFSIL